MTTRNHTKGKTPIKKTSPSRLPWHLNTRTLTAHVLYAPSIFLPLFAALVWLIGLMVLLGLWVSAGKPQYKSTQADIAFISDVGAANEDLFLSICCVVIILYFSTICVTRWFRHKGRLPETVQQKEKWFSKYGLAIVWCGVGCSGLFVLSKWNCWDYPKVHWYGTFVFITGVALSAIFQTAEVWCLRKEHEHRRHLRRNSYIKLAIVSVSVVLAIAFALMYSYCDGKNAKADGSHTMIQCNDHTSVAAVLEWTIAFGLNGYFLTLVADLWPAAKSNKRHQAAMKRLEQGGAA
ncbi:hypothetical protein IAU60_005380 [Kwoniella sp. DSM 27419]